MHEHDPMAAVRAALRDARARAGVTLTEVEEVTGIPAYQLSRIETGHTAEPKWSDMVRLAAYYGISQETLARHAEAVALVHEQNNTRVMLSNLFAYLERLSEHERAYVVKLLEGVVQAHRDNREALGLGQGEGATHGD